MSDWNEVDQNLKDAVDTGSGSAKPAAPDDPMQVRGNSVPGDQQVMLQCLIEEFARMGWDANQIGLLFENKFFLAAHSLAERLGRKAVRECIEQTLQRCGVFRFEMSESKPNKEPRICPILVERKPLPAQKFKTDLTLKGD